MAVMQLITLGICGRFLGVLLPAERGKNIDLTHFPHLHSTTISSSSHDRMFNKIMHFCVVALFKI